MIREINKAFLGFGHDKKKDKILTGKWGCGIFNGDVQLKFLIQWIAASLCNKKMLFFSLGDQSLNKINSIRNMFQGKKIGILVRLLLSFQINGRNMDLFTYLEFSLKIKNRSFL